jgi:hypothetical protein
LTLARTNRVEQEIRDAFERVAFTIWGELRTAFYEAGQELGRNIRRFERGVVPKTDLHRKRGK